MGLVLTVFLILRLSKRENFRRLSVSSNYSSYYSGSSLPGYLSNSPFLRVYHLSVVVYPMP